MSTFNGSQSSLRNTTLYDQKCNDKQTTMEVQELRHQVRMLSAELQQLRTNLSGSTQSLQVHCSDNLTAGVSNLNASGRVSWTSATVGLSPNSRTFMADDFKPPLPPRLYRPPVKPQRTFAQNGIPPSNNVQTMSSWLKSGLSMDCLPTISNNEGPVIPPRNYNGNRFVSKPPPPPPPKSYKRPIHFEPRTVPVNSNNGSQNNFSSIIQNSPLNGQHAQDNFSKSHPFQSKMDSNQTISGNANGEYSEVVKTSATNYLRNNCRKENRVVSKNAVSCKKIKNLSHFAEPMTAANFVHSLNVGFAEGFNWYQVGPVLLYLNSFNDASSKPVSLSTNTLVDKPIINLINDVHSHFHDSEASQAVVLSGERGSGKTHVTMQIFRQIFQSFGAKGSNYQNDTYRNFCATVDVLKSLTSIRRATSSFSNQTAFLYEMHITDGLVAKAKIHCCFLEESRLCGKTQGERNYQIFYQILAGLTPDERKKFHLNNHNAKTLDYLNSTYCQNMNDASSILENDKNQFHIWKTSLTLLGIPFSDVVRVLASVLLLGNVKFVETKDGVELDVESSKDLEAVAALLGITSATLYKSLTKYSTYIKRQWVKSSRTIQAIYDVRDSLAKTLYHRCIFAIVRRANSLKTSVRPGSGISSSDESCAHDSGIGMTSQMSEGTINSSQNSSQGADGLISVFDSFGFDNFQPNHFEQLCANYANEKLQSFYRTKLFRSNQQLLRDEGIENDYELDTFNSHLPNDDVLDVFLSPKTGIFYLLDEECASPSGSSSHFHQMLKQYNKNTKHLEFVNDSNVGGQQQLNFTVKHFTLTSMTYSADDFVVINRDLLSSDVIKMFSSNACNFGFVSHLFAPELRLDERQQNQTTYRISPSSNTDFSGRKSMTFCQDFTFQIDTFMKSLSSCKAHFVQCVKVNSKGECGKFIENEIERQIVQLDIIPLVRLLSTGLPYFVKLKEFNCRYKFLIIKYHGVFLAKAPSLIEETKVLLDCYLKAVDESNLPYVSNHWALGSQYIFLSEGAHQQLETLREEHRTKAAMILQKFVRHWLKKHRFSSKVGSWNVSNGRPRPLIGATISNSTIPAYHLVEKIASQQGLNLIETPPPLPAYRKYSIMGDHKTPFPQRRVMTDIFVDNQTKVKLNIGDIVTAIGWSAQQKRLIIRESKGEMIFVPFSLTKLCVQ